MSRAPLVSILAVAASAALAAGQQEPRFRAGTHTVSIYATVVDESGRLVPDLTGDDFEITDEGKPQTLTVFANDVQPITIVVMLDRSGSMMWNYDLVRESAEEFVSDLLPADRARIGNFSNRVEIDPPSFTSDRSELVRILRENLQDVGPTPLWNATSAAMNALESQQGRRVVLVFTDGQDAPPNPIGNATFGQVRDRSQSQEIMVYAIGLANGCGRDATTTLATPSGPRSEAPRVDINAVASGDHFQRVHDQRRGGPPPRGGPIRLPPFGGRIGFPPFGVPRIDPPPRVPLHPPAGESGDDRSGCVTSKPDANLAALAAVGGGGYFELHNTDDLRSTFKRVADELHHQYLLGFTPAVLDGKVHTLDVHVRRPSMKARARQNYVASGS